MYIYVYMYIHLYVYMYTCIYGLDPAYNTVRKRSFKK